MTLVEIFAASPWVEIRNPDLLQSLPAKMLEELEQRQDYVDLCKVIEDFFCPNHGPPTKEEREELVAQQYDMIPGRGCDWTATRSEEHK